MSRSAEIMIHRQYGIWVRERMAARTAALKELEVQFKNDLFKLRGDHSLRVQAQYHQYAVDKTELDDRERAEIDAEQAR